MAIVSVLPSTAKGSKAIVSNAIVSKAIVNVLPSTAIVSRAIG